MASLSALASAEALGASAACPPSPPETLPLPRRKQLFPSVSGLCLGALPSSSSSSSSAPAQRRQQQQKLKQPLPRQRRCLGVRADFSAAAQQPLRSHRFSSYDKDACGDGLFTDFSRRGKLTGETEGALTVHACTSREAVHQGREESKPECFGRHQQRLPLFLPHLSLSLPHLQGPVPAALRALLLLPGLAAKLVAAAAPRFVQLVPRLTVLALACALPHILRPASSLAHGGSAAASSLTHAPGGAHAHALQHLGPWEQGVRAGWTGLVAGCLHTLTGPDHLAALAPLTIGRSRMESAAIGALWGCGHDAGQVLFGLLFVLLKERLHLDFFRVWGPRVVGLTLIAIGVIGAYEANAAGSEDFDQMVAHAAHHDHGLVPPVPAAASASPAPASLSSAAAPAESRKSTFNVATFFTGIVHGLQPDALLVVLPALAMPSRVASASFLALFLLGTVVAMGSYTAFIGSCSDALRDRVPGMTRKLSWAAACLAVVLGVAMLLGEVLGFSFL